MVEEVSSFKWTLFVLVLCTLSLLDLAFQIYRVASYYGRVGLRRVAERLQPIPKKKHKKKKGSKKKAKKSYEYEDSSSSSGSESESSSSSEESY